MTFLRLKVPNQIFLVTISTFTPCICDRCKHAVLLLKKSGAKQWYHPLVKLCGSEAGKGRGQPVLLWDRAHIAWWHNYKCPNRSAAFAHGKQAPRAVSHELGCPESRSLTLGHGTCPRPCRGGHEGTRTPVLVRPVWSHILGEPAEGFQAQLQEELFPLFAWVGLEDTLRCWAIIAGLCWGSNWRHPGATSAWWHRAVQEELSPCLCSGTLPCPSWVWNHPGVSPAQTQGDAKQGVGTHHLSCQNPGGKDNYRC